MEQQENETVEFEAIEDRWQEAADITEIADLTEQSLHQRYPNQKILRGVHPKSHGCVNAVFKINDDIDEQYQVGLFKTPGRSYQAMIRYSNAAVKVEPDVEAVEVNGRQALKHGSRGMAVKVCAVDGDFLHLDDGQANQDFLMINQPGFAFANIKDYLRLNRILVKNKDNPSEFFAPLQVEVPGVNAEDKGRIAQTLQIAQKVQATPVANPLEVRYFGAAPFAFGQDRVMRFCVVPEQEPAQKLEDEPAENYLADALTSTMQQAEAQRYDFCIQVRGPGDGLNIENASMGWDENETPFVSVAKITIPAPQAPLDPEHCEELFFTPWHSLTDHKPLGGINRLRQTVYFKSAMLRKAKEFNRGFFGGLFKFFTG